MVPERHINVNKLALKLFFFKWSFCFRRDSDEITALLNSDSKLGKQTWQGPKYHE